MIGEQFEDGNEICGAVVSVRQRQDRIAIWTRTATNEETQIHIGKIDLPTLLGHNSALLNTVLV